MAACGRARDRGVTDVYGLIRQATLARRQVVATYKGYRRELCPHVLGTKNGRRQALFFQFSGPATATDAAPRKFPAITDATSFIFAPFGFVACRHDHDATSPATGVRTSEHGAAAFSLMLLIRACVQGRLSPRCSYAGGCFVRAQREV